MFQFAREGYPFILFALSLTVLALIFDAEWAAAVAFVLTLFMFYFFRDPERDTPSDKNSFISPADGKIIVISPEAEEDEMLHGKAVKISIFMSPLNVHVNRAPCSGIVKNVRYYPGKFFSAFKEDASIFNEHITMLMDSDLGKVVLKQIAGSVARRAVCRVKPGDALARGQRYGIIKFSSRVDVFLPPGTEVRVQMNDKVKAGETILAVGGGGSQRPN